MGLNSEVIKRWTNPMICCAIRLHYRHRLSWGGIERNANLMVMVLLKQPLCNHITGRGTASAIANSALKIHCSGWSERLRETQGERCNLHCLLAAAEWFYCKIDLTDHLISSLIHHSSQSTDSLSVWESDFKVPSTTQEMALQTFLYLVMASLIADCGMRQLKRHHWGLPAREWQSNSEDCFSVSHAEHGWPET